MLRPILLTLVLLLAAAAHGGEQPGTPLFCVVENSGLPERGATFGGTWADLDGDGLPDLVLSRHGNDDVEFFRNAGDLTFAALELAARPVGLLDHHGTAACDDDGDGVWDLYLTSGADRGAGRSCKQLWRHDGELGFSVAGGCEHLLADPAGRGRGALWLQLSPTELPSLLLLNFDSPPRLFGREGGEWADRSVRLGEFPDTASWIVAVTADLDGDRAPDLMTMGDDRRVWRNVGGGLEPSTDTGLSAVGPPVAAAAAGDLDGDGDPDLVLVLAGGVLQVMMNESTEGVIRFAGPVPQTLPRLGEPVSCALADLDNDGHLDLAVARRGRSNADRAPLVFLGAGDGTFQLPTGPTGLAGVPSRAMAIWAVDIDLDGDLDLVALNGQEVERDREGAVVVYENIGRRRGVTLELTPAEDGPPHALGATIALASGGVRQSRQVRSVANPWNSTVPALHFGVGDDPGPWTVTVIWPSGRRQIQQLSPSSGAYRLIEGVDEPAPPGALH